MYSATQLFFSLCSPQILVEEHKPNYNRRQTRVAWTHSRANKLFSLAQNAQTQMRERSSDFKHQFMVNDWQSLKFSHCAISDARIAAEAETACL